MIKDSFQRFVSSREGLIKANKKKLMDQLEPSAASKTLTWTESHTIDSI